MKSTKAKATYDYLEVVKKLNKKRKLNTIENNRNKKATLLWKREKYVFF